MPPSQLFPGAIPWRGKNTAKYVIIKSGIILKDTNPPFWISVNLRDTFKTLMKQDKRSFCVRENSPGDKKMVPNQLALICIWWCIWSWLLWVSVETLMSLLFFFAKLKCQILLQGISDASNIVIYHIYHTVTIDKSEKRKLVNSDSRFILQLKWF